MLSPAEQSQLQLAMGSVQRRASEILARTQESSQAIAFIAVLHSNMDALIAASVSADPAPQCKAGCAYCCSARVEVSDPEALYIARHVQQMSCEERSALLERLRMKATESDGSLDRPNPGPCAFLVQGLCSIYPVRPSVCRKAHSFSVSACETRSAQVPQSLTRVVRCEALLVSTNEAFESNGFPARRYELSAAVLAALVEGAPDSWYRGHALLPTA